MNADKFLLFSLKSYNNPCFCSMEDFLEDLARIKKIKKIFNKFKKDGEIESVKLLTSHFVILTNMFDSTALITILFYKLRNDDYFELIKTMLYFLNYLPKKTHIYDIDTEVPYIDINYININDRLLRLLINEK